MGFIWQCAVDAQPAGYSSLLNKRPGHIHISQVSIRVGNSSHFSVNNGVILNPGQPRATHSQFQQNTIFCLVTKGNPPLNPNGSYLQPDLTGKPICVKET